MPCGFIGELKTIMKTGFVLRKIGFKKYSKKIPKYYCVFSKYDGTCQKIGMDLPQT